MKRWIAVALLAAGCYRSSPPPAPPVADPARPVYSEPQATYAHARFRSMAQAPRERSVIGKAIDELAGFADDMCACTDQQCSDRVSQEMSRWSMELSRQHSDLKPTEDEMEEISQVSERLSKCMMTAMGYAGPSSPPPPPSP